MVVVSGNLKPLFSIITHAQLRNLRGAFIGDRPLPLSLLLGDLQRPSQNAAINGIAARRVLDEDAAWIEQLKPRLLDRTMPQTPPAQA